jgi:DNA polymerase-3 subunit epsilon
MYLFFDTETTGLPRDWKAPVTDLNNLPSLVQLAYLQFDNNGNKISEGDFIIKPNGYIIPKESSNIHGITHEKGMNEGVDLHNVLIDFHALINNSQTLVAYNMSFDEKIVGSEFLKNGFHNTIPSKPKICTMEKTTYFCNIPGFYGKPKWPKPSELHYKLFGFEFEEAHNAMIDINVTAKCFWELKRIVVI